MNDSYKFENNQLMLIPPFEHEEPEEDECGIPAHPIFAKDSNYLLMGHPRTGDLETGSPQPLATAAPSGIKPSE
jgi:hypothetical protein